MCTRRLSTSAAAMALLVLATLTIAEDFEVPWFTIDGGGGYSAGGSFQLEGTIGQHDAGPGTAGMSGGSFELVGGFWPGITADISLPGDCDGDGDVDLADFTGFHACLLGPGGGLDTGCDCFDFDGDADITLIDFVEFQGAFTGGAP